MFRLLTAASAAAAPATTAVKTATAAAVRCVSSTVAAHSNKGNESNEGNKGNEGNEGNESNEGNAPDAGPAAHELAGLFPGSTASATAAVDTWMGACQRAEQGAPREDDPTPAALASAADLALGAGIHVLETNPGVYPMALFGFLSHAWNSQESMDTVAAVMDSPNGASLPGWDFVLNVLRQGSPPYTQLVLAQAAAVADTLETNTPEEETVKALLLSINEFAAKRKVTPLDAWPILLLESPAAAKAALIDVQSAPESHAASFVLADMQKSFDPESPTDVIAFQFTSSLDVFKTLMGAWYATSNPAHVQRILELASLWAPAVGSIDPASLNGAKATMGNTIARVLISTAATNPWLKAQLVDLAGNTALTDRESMVIGHILDEIDPK